MDYNCPKSNSKRHHLIHTKQENNLIMMECLDCNQIINGYTVD